MLRIFKQNEGYAITSDSDTEGTLFVTDNEWEHFLVELKNKFNQNGKRTEFYCSSCGIEHSPPLHYD